MDLDYIRNTAMEYSNLKETIERSSREKMTVRGIDATGFVFSGFYVEDDMVVGIFSHPQKSKCEILLTVEEME